MAQAVRIRSKGAPECHLCTGKPVYRAEVRKTVKPRPYDRAVYSEERKTDTMGYHHKQVRHGTVAEKGQEREKGNQGQGVKHRKVLESNVIAEKASKRLKQDRNDRARQKYCKRGRPAYSRFGKNTDNVEREPRNEHRTHGNDTVKRPEWQAAHDFGKACIDRGAGRLPGWPYAGTPNEPHEPARNERCPSCRCGGGG